MKTSFVDPATPTIDPVSCFWEHIQTLRRQLHVARSGVYLWTSDLSGSDFHRLFQNTFGLISASFGEGFCGPAAYALALQKPFPFLLRAPAFGKVDDGRHESAHFSLLADVRGIGRLGRAKRLLGGG